MGLIDGAYSRPLPLEKSLAPNRFEVIFFDLLHGDS